MSISTFFTDPASVTALYSSPERCEQRTTTLRRAKVGGPDATATIARLTADLVELGTTVLEVGPGRGSVARALLRALAPRRLFCVDTSAALLRVVQERAPLAVPVRADFHRLPIESCSIGLAVAAFCLYHSAQPDVVVGEVARCLGTGRRGVFVTKSSASYKELDELMAASGIDPGAAQRPGLYDTFCTENAAEVVGSAFELEQVLVEPHTFRFADFDALASYVWTSAKYTLPRSVMDHHHLAAELRRRLEERPVTATSHVSYVVGVRP